MIQYGGEIKVQSYFGESTIFEIDLPIFKENRVERKESAQLKELNASPDLVLIDDTYTNHLAWEIGAERNNKKIVTFFSVNDFLTKSAEIEKNTPIFVDYVFKDDLNAGNKASQLVLDQGYSNVFIASGLFEKDIIAPSGVKVVGKDFPAELI